MLGCTEQMRLGLLDQGWRGRIAEKTGQCEFLNHPLLHYKALASSPHHVPEDPIQSWPLMKQSWSSIEGPRQPWSCCSKKKRSSTKQKLWKRRGAKAATKTIHLASNELCKCLSPFVLFADNFQKIKITKKSCAWAKAGYSYVGIPWR